MTVVPLYSQLCFIQMIPFIQCLWKSQSADAVDVWFDKLSLPPHLYLQMILHVVKAHDMILKTLKTTDE